MAKRGAATAYKTPSGYSIKKEDYASLRRAIENFNKRVTRAAGRTDPLLRSVLPGRVRLTEARALITSKRDINRIITDLNLFRGAGFDIVQYGGTYTTKAQKKVTQKAITRENKRRAKIAAVTQNIMKAEGRFPTQGTEETRPVSVERYQKDRRNSLLSIIQDRQVDQRAVALQARYIDHVNMALNNALIEGTANQEAIEAAHEIIRIIESLTPEQMLIAQVGVPELSIGETSDENLFIYAIDEYLQAWENFAALW